MTDETNTIKAATLTQVAQQAGVNKVTASIVLSGGRGNTRVSEATRQRIIRVAEELQYRPNALARSLRGRKTHIIGFYMGTFIDVRNMFLGEIISGLQQACEQNQHDFLVHGTFRGNSINEIYSELVNGKVDGLVVFTGSHADLIKKLIASHLPVVTIADPHPGLPTVTVDDAAGSRLLAQHLAGKGHRHVLYGICPFNLSSTVRRFDAFRAAAEELSMTVSARLGREQGRTVSEAEREFLSWDVAHAGASGPEKVRPTAFVCWNDEMAHGAISYLTTNGLRVPEDVAVAGFDGWDSIVALPYQLTTIRAPWRDVARVAVDLLVKNPGKPVEEDTILPVELVVGDTA